VTISSVYLQPGEWFVCDGPTAIQTILGSCVGIVMRHPHGPTCVAHCMLPRWNALPGPPGEARFVDRCLTDMIALFDRRGLSRNQLAAMLFGGGRLLPGAAAGRMPGVGRQNVEAALSILHREGVDIVRQDVGGNRGRKLLVLSHTGEVTVSTISPLRLASPEEAVA